MSNYFAEVIETALAYLRNPPVLDRLGRDTQTWPSGSRDAFIQEHFWDEILDDAAESIRQEIDKEILREIIAEARA